LGTVLRTITQVQILDSRARFRHCKQRDFARKVTTYDVRYWPLAGMR